MDLNELRHRVMTVLRQADGPLDAARIRALAAVPEAQARAALRGLMDESLVVEVAALGQPAQVRYRWAAYWRTEDQQRAEKARRNLANFVAAVARVPDDQLDVESEPSCAFYDYVIHHYTPPDDKRMLVFLQCSVRRPFSRSPSHAAMCRAITLAAGSDPRARGPVHVVVLASKVGPVPYDLEDVYPANVRSGGVKHSSRTEYERVKPVLAARMAGYLVTHRRHYDRIAAFTEGRYGDVMRAAQRAASVDFPVLPRDEGPQVLRVGRSTPRKYWEKYWIQLYLTIRDWLEPAPRAQADGRLRQLGVQWQ